MSDDDNTPEVPVPPTLAEKLKRIQRVTVDAFDRRGRVPQPLFWSLFHSEIKQLRKEKELKRVLDEILDK